MGKAKEKFRAGEDKCSFLDEITKRLRERFEEELEKGFKERSVRLQATVRSAQANALREAGLRADMARQRDDARKKLTDLAESLRKVFGESLDPEIVANAYARDPMRAVLDLQALVEREKRANALLKLRTEERDRSHKLLTRAKDLLEEFTAGQVTKDTNAGAMELVNRCEKELA